MPSYRAWNATKAVGTDWQKKTVDCTDLKPGFCHMTVDLDDSDGWAEIYGVGWFQDGKQVWLPMGATISYKGWNAAKSVSSGDYKTFKVDCHDLVVGFCNMGFQLSGGYAWAAIYGVGWFQNGGHVWLPVGANISYQACDANKQNCTGWQGKSVDCTDLVYPPGP
jgi:hypothetical protein